MFAIVTIAGQQFKVEEGQEIFVHRLDAKEGDQLSFDDVLLVSNGSGVSLGQPHVSGASVSAQVKEHIKGDKVIVFKKKRRKGYRRKKGHRQQFTKIEIGSIGAGKSNFKKVEKKAEPSPKVETEKKAAPVKQAATVKKSAPQGNPDDLTKVEGLGPKAKEILTAANITTFKQLSELDAVKIKEILVEGSSRMNIIQTDTWPKQAKLAAEGKWDELKAWQDELDGGKE